jgi:recombination protein RecT
MSTPTQSIVKGESAVLATKPQENRLEYLLGKDNVKERFDKMLGRKAPGFISSIISAVKSNKNLEQCEPMSVISAAAVAASLDLPINPSLGMAHIVPYSNVAQFQMGWKGFVQLALRTGQYKTLNVSEVYEGEIFKHDVFTGEMEFKQSEKRENIIGYVFYFKLLNGFEKYFYMTKQECEKHGKKYSQTYKKGFGRWVEDFDGQAKKTVIKLGLGKYGVLSIEMQNAFKTDEAVVDTTGEVVEYPDNTKEEKKQAEPISSRLHDAIEVKSESSQIPFGGE